MPRAPLPSAGSSGSVPRPLRYYGDIRLPALRTVRSVAVTSATASMCGKRGVSQVPGEPLCVRAPLSDPGEPSRRLPLLLRDEVAFRQHDGVGLATLYLSGLNHAARTLPVYASPTVLPRTTQHAVPAGRHPLPGGTCTLGFQCRVSAALLVISHRRFLLTQVSLAHRARNRFLFVLVLVIGGFLIRVRLRERVRLNTSITSTITSTSTKKTAANDE